MKKCLSYLLLFFLFNLKFYLYKRAGKEQYLEILLFQFNFFHHKSLKMSLLQQGKSTPAAVSVTTDK